MGQQWPRVALDIANAIPMSAATEALAGKLDNEGQPISPQRVFTELSSRLPDNCILTSDSGSAANGYARDIKIHEGMMGTLSGNLATMCPGIPYAIAAKFCWPDRTVIALVGDGAMEMLGINGLITISRYWKDWSDPRWPTSCSRFLELGHRGRPRDDRCYPARFGIAS